MEKKFKKIGINFSLFIKRKKIIDKFECNFITFLNIIILIILLILVLNYFFNKNNNIFESEKDKIINSNVDTILRTFSYNASIKDSMQPYLKFVEYTKEGFLLNSDKFFYYIKPKISIVISLYNREQYIKSAIRSLQNQNFIEIEIIIVDDFSTDNSTKCIKELQKNDYRIILLKNKENMGTLYSKSIGVLYAKGEYIHSLDSDDMFCNQNYLSTCYDIAIKGNFDFVSTQGLYINEINKHIFIKEPNFVVIWSKLIKREIYQDSIFEVGVDILKMKVLTFDDNIISFMFQFKKAIKIPIVGIAHFIHESQHIYFNNQRSKKNTKIFCRNLLTAIKSFFMFNNTFGFRRGDFILKKFFINGTCSEFSSKKEVQLLIENDIVCKNYSRLIE